MRKLFVVTLVLGFFITLPGLALANPETASSPGDWTGNLNFFLGAKALDQDDWEPVEDQNEFGIKVDFKKQEWPMSIAIDYLSSIGDDTILLYDPWWGYVLADVESNTSELCFGVRKIWDHSPRMRPFIGVGLAMISAEATVRTWALSLSDDDKAMGFWIGGGIYWTLTEHFNIGFNLRWSKAEINLFDVDTEAGGTHAGLLVGYHW